MSAITDVALPTLIERAGESTRLVVFVDEIDAVRSLPFSTDEFFAAIRECYNRRTEEPDLDRLTFCLLGVATPSDLIRDTRTTPFNIGRRIELNDFTQEEARPLSEGLGSGDTENRGNGETAQASSDSPFPRFPDSPTPRFRSESGPAIQPRTQSQREALLWRILYWTSGHPYLTQRLCQAVAEDASVRGPAGVDRVCEELFLSTRARESDDNLLFVRERLLRSEADPAGLLDLYAQVRSRKRVKDDETNPLVSVLRLSGVTRVVEGYLWVRNRIYFRVFDRDWVTGNMPDAELRRQKAAYQQGLLRAGAVAAAVVLVTSSLAGWAIGERKRADRERNSAREQTRLAQGRLARLYVGKGNELVDQGDLGGSLPWLVKALETEDKDPERETMHRVRIASVIRQRLRLLQFFLHDGPVNHASFSSDGTRVVTASYDQTARVWSVEPEQRSLEVLKRLALVLSSQTIDATEAAVPADPKAIREALIWLRQHDPRYFDRW